MKLKQTALLIFLKTVCLHAIDLRENELMFCRFILFPSRVKITESYSPEEWALFEKVQLFEKLDGRTVLLTTVIRWVYQACSASAEKEALLRALLRPYCSNPEIEWAVKHMHVYVSRYGDDETYSPWV